MIESEKEVSYTIVTQHRLLGLEASFPEDGQYKMVARIGISSKDKETGELIGTDMRLAIISPIQLEQIAPGTLQMCQELADKITRAFVDGKFTPNKLPTAGTSTNGS